MCIAFVGGTIVSVTGANVRAMLQNVNTPETRSTGIYIHAYIHTYIHIHIHIIKISSNYVCTGTKQNKNTFICMHNCIKLYH